MKIKQSRMQSSKKSSPYSSEQPSCFGKQSAKKMVPVQSTPRYAGTVKPKTQVEYSEYSDTLRVFSLYELDYTGRNS